MSQTDLFGVRAKPKPVRVPAQIEGQVRSMLEPEEQDKVVIVGRAADDQATVNDKNRFEPKENHEPRRCPGCYALMTPQRDASHLQVCRQCDKGYNVNFKPPRIYYEVKKTLPSNNARDSGSRSEDSTSQASLSCHKRAVCQKCGRQAMTEYDTGCRDDSVRDLCKECLKERYKDIRPGFRNTDDEQVEVFSHTTGWERIKFKWVKEFINPAIMGNSMFPVNVCLQHQEMTAHSGQNIDHHTYGITWAAARFLSVKTGVPIPAEAYS